MPEADISATPADLGKSEPGEDQPPPAKQRLTRFRDLLLPGDDFEPVRAVGMRRRYKKL
jgi:hypothetical protein